MTDITLKLSPIHAKILTMHLNFNMDRFDKTSDVIEYAFLQDIANKLENEGIYYFDYDNKFKKEAKELINSDSNLKECYDTYHKLKEIKNKKSKYKASKFVFLVPSPEDNDFEFPTVYISTEEFWNDHHYIDDSLNSSDVDGILPEGFEEIMEACFEFRKGTIEQAIEALTSAGFKQVKE